MPIFDPDSKFMQVTSTMLDYWKLGLLFLLFSIPVIPMGAAAAAAMTVAMKIARGEAPAVWEPFWNAFKSNFKQGTVLLLIFGAIFALFGLDWYLLMELDSTNVIRVARAAMLVLALVAVPMALYSFAIIARYELPVKAVLRNSVIYTLLYFPKNLVVVGMILAGFLAYDYIPAIIPLVVAIMPSVVIWYFAKNCVAVFRKSESRAQEDA